MKVLEFEELSMEAVWKIEVEDFPAFTVLNHEGEDFYAELDTQKAAGLLQVGGSAKNKKWSSGGLIFHRQVRQVVIQSYVF